jgi:hypothetical protein
MFLDLFYPRVTAPKSRAVKKGTNVDIETFLREMLVIYSMENDLYFL